MEVARLKGALSRLASAVLVWAARKPRAVESLVWINRQRVVQLRAATRAAARRAAAAPAWVEGPQPAQRPQVQPETPQVEARLQPTRRRQAVHPAPVVHRAQTLERQEPAARRAAVEQLQLVALRPLAAHGQPVALPQLPVRRRQGEQLAQQAVLQQAALQQAAIQRLAAPPRCQRVVPPTVVQILKAPLADSAGRSGRMAQVAAHA